MAQRGDELNTRLTATDDASAVVDRVADKVGELEDRPHEVEVDADTDKAEEAASALDRRLEGLTDKQRRIVLDVMARDAQRDLDRINRELARAEKYDDDEIAIRVNARGDAERKLDAIQAEIRDLDGASPTIRPEVDGSELDQFIDQLGDMTGFGGLGRLRGAGGAAGLGAAIAGGFVLAGDAAADAAIEIDNVAKLTGDSIEFASRLAGVMGRAGVETKDLQDILLQMGGVLEDDAELAERLGVNLDDGRSLGERFVQVVELLGDRFTDTSERSLVASRLFGEEGVRQVNSVTAAYGDLSAAVDEYNGKVFTEQDAAEAREYKQALNEIKSELELIALEVGANTVPVLGDMLQALQDIDRWASVNGGPGLFDRIGAALMNPFDPGSVIIDNWAQTARAGEESAGTVRRAFGDTFADLRNRIREVADELAAFEPPEQVVGAAEQISREIELARQNFDRFGADGVENMNQVSDAASGTAGSIAGISEAFDALLGRLSEESAVNNLAEQWDNVLEAQAEYFTAEKEGSGAATKAQREYRDELIKLALDVGRFAEQVGDIPEERLVRLATAIEGNSLTEIERALDEIFTDRTIRLDVQAPGPTRFRRTDDGGWERIDTGGSRAAVTTQPAPQQGNTYIYTVNPTPQQTSANQRELTFTGGYRPR